LGTGSCTITCDPGGPRPPEREEVRTWRDLDAIRGNLGGHYVLMNNLHANTAGYDELVGNTADGKGWEPIGTDDARFTGSFDGQGHEIRGLVINRPDEDNVGLFGCLSRGVIKNFGVIAADVTGKERVGVLVGYNHFGTVGSEGLPFTRYSTYSREGIVRGIEDVGGLVGRNWQGTVSQCESSTTVSHLPGSSGETRWRVGGLVGANYGPVINCRYEGEVTGHSEVGGLVGLNFFPGTIAACGGEYSVMGERFVGGVAGWNAPRARIHGAWFNGDVNGVPFENVLTLNEGVIGHAHSSDTLPPGSYVGGLVGRNDGEVEECSASGTVTGTFNVGGLAGANANEGTLEDCSSVGDVIGDSNVGGLVGLNEGMVSNSYSGGSVTGEQAVGRLVGFNSGTVSHSDSDARATCAGEDVADLVGDNRGRILHRLTVSSTGGGSVTTPGEGTFTYDSGEVVTLIAAPSAGYRFANWTGDVKSIRDASAASTEITMLGNYDVAASFEKHTPGDYTPMVAAGAFHTVGLKSDGTVVAVGYCDDVDDDDDWHHGQCKVGDWIDIIEVAAGGLHTVGLKSDGTVVAVGAGLHVGDEPHFGQCKVGDWTGIVQVAAGYAHTVGLRSDGTVVAVGAGLHVGDEPHFGQCKVGDWTDIIKVAAGGLHTVGLKSDGTVVAVGAGLHVGDDPHFGQCKVGDWTDIIKVAAGALHTVGLKSDGTLVAVGDNRDLQCDVGVWTDIVRWRQATFTRWDSSPTAPLSPWEPARTPAGLGLASARSVTGRTWSRWRQALFTQRGSGPTVPW